ncbi:MAG: hypothetical protein FWG71_10855, partial [Synergistaceae bacterium]|nr:hypothetical protein [Synergistaceae bacterium]
GTMTTTNIDLEFDKAITGLSSDSITITPDSGAAAKGEVSGSGRNWSLTVTGVTQGTVNVDVSSYGTYTISGSPKTVSVFVAGTPFVPVTSITEIPTSATTGTLLSLTGTVNPSNATNKAIVWSVQNAGATGATITGSTFNATAAGTATVRATIANGAAVGTNYTQDVSITVNVPFVPVTSITGMPTSATAGTPLSLTGTVNPSNATNKAIVWSVQNAGTTGATITGSTLNTTAAGAATVRATIANGAAVGTNYTQDVSITVNADNNGGQTPDPARASTDITADGVFIGGVNYNIVRQADESWLVTAPYGTNLSNLVLIFVPPHPDTKITPMNGSSHDFSDDKIVTFTVISADELNTQTYNVRVVVREFEVAEGNITTTLPAQWTLNATRNSNGSFSFTLTAPIDLSVTSSRLPSHIYVTISPLFSGLSLAILDRNGTVLAPYPNNPFVPKNSSNAVADAEPMFLRLTGVAENLLALELLYITQIDYAFADEAGQSYQQALNPPVTYDSVGERTVDQIPVTPPINPPVIPNPSPGGQGGGGGGCSADFAGMALALVIFFFLRNKRTKER